MVGVFHTWTIHAMFVGCIVAVIGWLGVELQNANLLFYVCR